VLPRIPGDQLGPFPPGTVIWALTDAAPIWPARVLGYTEAFTELPKRRLATVAQLRRLRDGSTSGVAVRFFGDSSVALIENGMGLPFVPAAVDTMDWVWRATKIDGVGRGWSEIIYSDATKRDWRDACREAVVYWRRRLGGRDEETKDYAGLSPGTLVWGLCEASPFWPGRIASQHDIAMSGVERDNADSGDGYVPVMYCGPGGGFAWMSLYVRERRVAIISRQTATPCSRHEQVAYLVLFPRPDFLPLFLALSGATSRSTCQV
jgi:hypothetical protein